jgi:rSAM/selenodomain-associated transferase 1
VGRGAALVLYARAPRAGRVKTRMLPWLDAGEALRLHLVLLEDSLRLLKACAVAAGASPFVSMSEPWEPEDPDGCAGIAEAALGMARLPQRGADLGERLQDTFRTLLARGLGPVVVIGSDSPTLPPAHLTTALSALERGADAVLGPAEDGGYCLVGAARELPGMFEGIPWGTDRVLQATRAALDRWGARVVLLPSWYDVDLPRDLERLRRDLSGGPSGEAAPRGTSAFVQALVRDGRLPLPHAQAPDPA